MIPLPQLKPDHTIWNAHDGGPCPLRPEVLVMIRYRNGEVVGPVEAKSRRWQRWPMSVGRKGLSAFDVKAFKLVETA